MAEAQSDNLPQSLVDQYVPVIDGILKSADLNTISAKKIRAGLQDRFPDHDINSNKSEVNILIMQRFDVAAANGPPSPAPAVNGVKTEPSRTAASNGKRPLDAVSTNGKRPSPATDSSSASSPRPAKKQHRSQPSMEDLDAAYAARLQAEENGRARTTRGGARGGSASGKKGSPAKREGKPKKRKSKSKAKVDSGEESDADGERKEEKERKGGFHKPMVLSTPLAELLGEQTLSRPQTVKKLWEYIKAHDLQDPTDKRQIVCDARLRSVFKTERVHMFTMNRILNQNLYGVDE